MVFGSRGSLGGGQLNRKPLGDSDSEEEEVDMLGSRGSLSGSLFRWTTEENLSMCGSQDKMDLVDGPLHDSHSNSTDSGIQSVGDSIRGSSDSVTNKDNATALLTTDKSSKSPQGSNASSCSQKPVKSASGVVANQTATTASIVEKVFGGKLKTTYQCSNCSNVSTRTESFIDLNLAVPGKRDKDEDEKTIQQLLTEYLNPEELCGENQYHCDKCSRLHDAEKRTEVLEGPTHLMCTLMRFHYDRAHSRKTKICTKLSYDQSLILPTGREGDVEYSLYAVVVHSGYSSDGGHYYTYAREPHVPDVWYIFNDSKVSYSSFSSFANLSTKFPVDTAYVLFYHRKGLELPNPTLPLLRHDLRLAVDRDNMKFHREKERSSSAPTASFRLDKGGDGDDDDDGPGYSSAGGGSCGGGSVFNEPGRFVC